MPLRKMQSQGSAGRYTCSHLGSMTDGVLDGVLDGVVGWPIMWVRRLHQRFRIHVIGNRRRSFDPSGPRRLTCNDEGAVTAEFAVVLPAVMAMAVLLMMLARAVTVEMNCQDAASAAARVAVVSRSDAEARLAAHQAAGGDVNVSISRGLKQIKVTVSCRVVPDPMHVLPMAVVGKATGVVQWGGRRNFAKLKKSQGVSSWSTRHKVAGNAEIGVCLMVPGSLYGVGKNTCRLCPRCSSLGRVRWLTVIGFVVVVFVMKGPEP